MKKRGQFFLLAAVIISAVIISLGTGANRAIVNDEPESFYDFSYEVKREVGAVLDYDVYSGFSTNINLEEFVEFMASDIQERSPGSDFIFIYGNKTDMTLKNYGTESVYRDGIEVEGLRENAESTICLGKVCQNITDSVVPFNNTDTSNPDVYMQTRPDNSVLVNIEGNDITFNLSEHKQVIFIMKKNIGGDRHLIIE